MTAKLVLSLDAMPAVISESAAAVLKPHGFIVCDHQGRPLDAERLAHLFRELGNNVSQALVSIDEGAGARSVTSCPACRGTGRVVVHSFMQGPRERTCVSCDGHGHF